MKILFLFFISLVFNFVCAGQPVKPIVEEDGTIQVPAFRLPESSLLDEESIAARKFYRDKISPEYRSRDRECGAVSDAKLSDITSIRNCRADHFYASSMYKNMMKRYEVRVRKREVNGVLVEEFTPSAGISKNNKDRVLINVHGGGFLVGARSTGHLESIPIASIGGYRIISIDYRMAPEYQFPSASKDVASVYRELLKKYQPENIGIFGCSAGGLLTAQAVSWFKSINLPVPGAVGMFCAAAYFWTEGDSGYIDSAQSGHPFISSIDNAYLASADPQDPLAFPGKSDEVMAAFPSSLLIGSTRDMAMSSIVKTHSQLVRLGVDAELYLWEGLRHGFFLNSEIPESREAYNIIVDFFNRKLTPSVASK